MTLRRAPPFEATVGYVRRLEISSLSVWCKGKREGAWPCHHGGTVALEGIADEEPLLAVERRLVCTACGAIGAADVRPNWAEIGQTGLKSALMNRLID